MTLILLIAAGGAAAALVHHMLTQNITDRRRVLLLTVGSCGVLGFVTAAAPPQWVVGLVCFGVLGSLAPMSSVAWLTILQFRDRRYRDGTLFLAANVIGGIACAMFGVLLFSSGTTLYRKF